MHASKQPKITRIRHTNSRTKAISALIACSSAQEDCKALAIWVVGLMHGWYAAQPCQFKVKCAAGFCHKALNKYLATAIILLIKGLNDSLATIIMLSHHMIYFATLSRVTVSIATTTIYNHMSVTWLDKQSTFLTTSIKTRFSTVFFSFFHFFFFHYFICFELLGISVFSLFFST